MDRAARRRRLLYGGLLALGAYAAYQGYHSDSFRKKRQELYENYERLYNSICKYGEVVSSGAEILAVLARDLLTFVTSERDEVPQSLCQIAKLLRYAAHDISPQVYSSHVAALNDICISRYPVPSSPLLRSLQHLRIVLSSLTAGAPTVSPRSRPTCRPPYRRLLMLATARPRAPSPPV